MPLPDYLAEASMYGELGSKGGLYFPGYPEEIGFSAIEELLAYCQNSPPRKLSIMVYTDWTPWDDANHPSNY